MRSNLNTAAASASNFGEAEPGCVFYQLIPGDSFQFTEQSSSKKLGTLPHPSEVRMGVEDYKKEGRKFYRMAAEHPSAGELDLSDVFWTLHEDFPKAKKPLNFIAEHYLRYRRYRFFG